MPDAPTPTPPLPRCGDHVLHLPSSETWVVAWAEGELLAPCGYPNSIADVADCEVTLRADDEEHRRCVEIWRGSSPEPHDNRRERVLRLYAPPAPDPIVAEVREDLLRRSEIGLRKYGVGLDRTDLTPRQWAQHAYEEALDHALYLKRLMQELA